MIWISGSGNKFDGDRTGVFAPDREVGSLHLKFERISHWGSFDKPDELVREHSKVQQFLGNRLVLIKRHDTCRLAWTKFGQRYRVHVDE